MLHTWSSVTDLSALFHPARRTTPPRAPAPPGALGPVQTPPARGARQRRVLSEAQAAPLPLGFRTAQLL